MRFSEKLLYSLWKICSKFVLTTLPIIILSTLLGILGFIISGPLGSSFTTISSFILLKFPFLILMFTIATRNMIKQYKNPRNPFSYWELVSQAYLMNVDALVKTFLKDPLEKINDLEY